MKSTLLILLTCICLRPSGLFADSGEIDPLLNNRVVDRSKNNFQLYDYEIRENPRLRLLTTLPIYDNKELRGTPSFLIDNEKVIDQRSNARKTYIYKDHFHHDWKTQGTKVKDLPMEFVTATTNGFYLGVSDYKNGIAMVKDKNKEYFLKFKTNMFMGNKWPSPIWKTDTNRESVLKYLQDLEKTDKEFQVLINPVRKCLNEKNLACFKKSIKDESSDTDYGIFIDHEISVWSIANDDELCPIFKEHLDKEVELAKKVKKKVIPWRIYEKGFSFKDPETQFTHTIEEFGKSETINVSLEGKQACDAGEDFEVIFERNLGLSTNKWEMKFKRGIINPVGD